VDDYLARYPPEVQATLRQVRAAIRKALPKAEEAISYGIPTYRQDGTYVVYFAGWKKHFSLYPVSERVRTDLGDALAPHEVEKGTIRFALNEPVPARLIGRIVKALARDAAERGRAKQDRKAGLSTGRRPPAGRGRRARGRGRASGARGPSGG
jgi:uncharacterized protein YdhG (YjbR/CyaY superfamily)